MEPGPSDSELIRAVRAGDQNAASALVNRHIRSAWAAAYAVTGSRSMAEDAVQDAFERVVRYLDRFDERRPFRPWLHRITVNAALDMASQARRRAEEPLGDDADEYADFSLSPEQTAAFHAALADLSPERRAVVVMRTLLGLSAEEAGRMIKAPAGTVHSRLSRALADLRRMLGDSG